MVSKVEEELPPQHMNYFRDFSYPTQPEPFYQNYETGVPIAIDFGSSSFKAGLTNSDLPNNVFPSLVSRWRDRKSTKTLTLVGNDTHTDVLLRSSTKSPFDGQLVTNWDYIESMFDYTFEHLGVTSDNYAVNNPIIMTEPVACPFSQRSHMYELMFEAYQVPKIAFGIDSLFGNYYSSPSPQSDGLVINAGNEQTHVIPVIKGKGILLQTKRIDWGGNTAQAFLNKLLTLKYPYFPVKLNTNHTTNLLHDYCYVLHNYLDELKTILDMDVLEEKDVAIQMPVEINNVATKKSQEELDRQMDKRREQGRRLQEQAQAKRLEKLAQKQKEWEYYGALKEEFVSMSEQEVLSRVIDEGFEGMSDFNKYISALEKTIKKANNPDGEDTEETIDPATAWPLADIPDDQLSEEEIKEKRKQRLLKGNYEARERNKEIKKQEDEARLKLEQEEQEWRERDLDGWSSAKRVELSDLITAYKDRAKLISSFKDRKSAAAQQRMKNIADLANDQNGSTNAATRKRRRNANASIDNDPNDSFGANDEDWSVYRDISNTTLEEEQQKTEEQITALEAELLKHDPNFNHEDTFAVAQTFDWRKLSLHKFIHGPRPNIVATLQQQGMDQDELANNPDVIRKNHQMHLNVERIRVPEILFQTQIAGLDQAGIPEIVHDLLYRRLDGNFTPGSQAYNMIQNVYLSGGLTNMKNFKSRIVQELTSFLPVGAPLSVRSAENTQLDPWKGMRKWSSSDEAKNSYVTRQEYHEMGPEYIKEHNLGNVCLM